jgi:hypothetical protein
VGILRLADAFDFLHDQIINRVSVERQGEMVIIYGHGLQEVGPAGERLARARYLLETTCACPIMVRPQVIKPVRTSHNVGYPRRVASGS